MTTSRNRTESQGKSRNALVRVSTGIVGFLATYQDVVAEARRRYPESFR